MPRKAKVMDLHMIQQFPIQQLTVQKRCVRDHETKQLKELISDGAKK